MIETRWEYDLLGRLADTNFKTRFTYDRVGNLLTQRDRSGATNTYFCDGLNRLTDIQTPSLALVSAT